MKIEVKPSGCVNPYHPPECPNYGMQHECYRALTDPKLMVLPEKMVCEIRDIVGRRLPSLVNNLLILDILDGRRA